MILSITANVTLGENKTKQNIYFMQAADTTWWTGENWELLGKKKMVRGTRVQQEVRVVVGVSGEGVVVRVLEVMNTHAHNRVHADIDMYTLANACRHKLAISDTKKEGGSVCTLTPEALGCAIWQLRGDV